MAPDTAPNGDEDRITDSAATVVHLVWHGSELRGIYGTRERADTARAVLDEQEAAEYGPLALRTEVTTVEVR